MITETELRQALRSRAANARVFDADNLLRHVDLATTGSAGARVRDRRGRQWILTGAAAACVVAVAATPAMLLDHSSTHRQQPVSLGAGAATKPNTPSVSVRPTRTAPSTRPNTPAAGGSGKGVAHSQTPGPAASDWVDSRNDRGMVIDPSAIVFSADPIVGYYQRPHQQLSILPAGATAKDSSDAQWHTAVQVYLPGSDFDPTPVRTAPTITVNGISRHVTDQPRVLDVPGPALVPSLAWPVGQAWVVLQIDTPAEPTSAQLAAAAARLDVHSG